MSDTYSYALIRAVPDARRGEWVNIGVVVFLPDRLDVRLLRDLSKLRVMDPSLDLSLLDELEDGWNAMARKGKVGERHSILARCPVAHASPLAWFISSAEDYERNVAAIMTDLVIPKPARSPIRSAQNKPSLYLE